jgi:formylglycine-generating enzyme required for sulfatase activity
MTGNVREWTRTVYRPYPYREEAERGNGAGERHAVRGGSWFDRPIDARSGVRFAYWPWQGAFDVGFRVVAPAK